jgi:hypothetical protein
MQFVRLVDFAALILSEIGVSRQLQLLEAHQTSPVSNSCDPVCDNDEGQNILAF